MRFVRTGLLVLVVLLGGVKAAAQEKPSPPPPQQLKVQFVFTESEGERKLSTLPYVLYVEVTTPRTKSSLRSGMKVPLQVSGQQFQYMDVGTNIDCLAEALDDGRYRLHVILDRSSAYGPEGKESPREGMSLGPAPILVSFRADHALLLRDGQTLESVLVTDPISGRVLRVQVTLNVVK